MEMVEIYALMIATDGIARKTYESIDDMATNKKANGRNHYLPNVR